MPLNWSKTKIINVQVVIDIAECEDGGQLYRINTVDVNGKKVEKVNPGGPEDVYEVFKDEVSGYSVTLEGFCF